MNIDKKYESNIGNKMKFTDPDISCLVCYELFSRQKLARFFKNCGHTCCEQCIALIILNSKNSEIVCPFCRKTCGYEIKYDNVNDISKIVKTNHPINYLIHDLVDDNKDVYLYFGDAIQILKRNLLSVKNCSVYSCFNLKQNSSYSEDCCFSVNQRKMSWYYKTHKEDDILIQCDNCIKKISIDTNKAKQVICVSIKNNTNMLYFKHINDFLNDHYFWLYSFLMNIDEKSKFYCFDNIFFSKRSNRQYILKIEDIFKLFQSYRELIKNFDILEKMLCVYQLIIEYITNLEKISQMSLT